MSPDAIMGINAIQFFGIMDAMDNIAEAEKDAYEDELEKQRTKDKRVYHKGRYF